jgi:hypothetical protein
MYFYLVGAANRVEFVQFLLRELEHYPEITAAAVEGASRTPASKHLPTFTTQLDYKDPGFVDFLLGLPDSENSVFLALMDGAVPAIVKSGLKSPSNQSSIQVCDKSWLKNLARDSGVPVPLDLDKGWAHVRPKVGNGSKGIGKQHLGPEFSRSDEFLYEEILEGVEVSIDAYRFTDGSYSAIARDRLRVVGGEVQHTMTRELTISESKVIDDLLQATKLRGPLNIQLMGDKSTLLEINPRFGGGCTASFHAGWPALRWVLTEYALDKNVSRQKIQYKHVEVKRAWTDFVWEV